MPHSYIRFESPVPDDDGRHPGLFTLLRLLRTSGRLTADDETLAEALVARSYDLHAEPPEAAFSTDPHAVSWFQDLPAAADLIELAAEVVRLLDRYGIACREVRSTRPGTITYADEVQVAAIPQTAGDSPWRKSVTSGSASNPAAT